jgi:carboxyl-terminal processing protease
MILSFFKKITTVLIFFITIHAGIQAQNKQDFELNKNLDIFFSVLRELRLFYVDSLQIENLIQSGINGITSKLDPYTDFVPEEKINDFEFSLTGRYGGIGALIQKDSNYTRIAEQYKGFPADLAGLVSGDRILEIDGKSLKDVSLDVASNMLKGSPGTTVNLKTLKLVDGNIVDLKIKRRRIHLSGIVYSGMLRDGIGYIRLTSFTENCSKDFREALNNLRKTANLKSLVIDFRANGGGSFDEAINILGLFLPKGTEVVSARGREKNFDATYHTR